MRRFTDRRVARHVKHAMLQVYGGVFLLCVAVMMIYHGGLAQNFRDNARRRLGSSQDDDEDRPDTCADLVVPELQIIIMAIAELRLHPASGIVPS